MQKQKIANSIISLIAMIFLFTGCKDDHAPNLCYTGHLWGEYKPVSLYSCTTDGIKTRSCTRSGCKATEQETDPARHTYSADATCVTEQICVICLTVIETETGHNMGEWEVIEPATDREDGYEEAICGNCNYVDTRIINATLNPDLYFTLINNNTSYSVIVQIPQVGFPRISGEVVIPAMYRPDSNSQYLPVTEIGDFAFRFCLGITSIIIPESVTSIGNSAFRDCTSLASVTLGTITENNFSNSSSFPGNLRTVYFQQPEGLRPGTYITDDPGENPVWRKE